MVPFVVLGACDGPRGFKIGPDSGNHWCHCADHAFCDVRPTVNEFSADFNARQVANSQNGKDLKKLAREYLATSGGLIQSSRHRFLASMKAAKANAAREAYEWPQAKVVASDDGALRGVQAGQMPNYVRDFIEEIPDRAFYGLRRPIRGHPI
ncbi:MAG: hypothetical protein M1826_001659 [Phylliscum demangeonii]|nr:MAG: hypothetical protein M1826_001659 [Phylliscum demangeonii]